MPFRIACRYCASTSGTVLTVPGFIEPRDDDTLRAHLRSAHPDLAIETGLGELLRHFDVTPVPPTEE